MRKRIRRIISMFLIVAAMLSVMSPVLAATPPEPDAPDASYYIDNVYAEATGTHGTVNVYFSITGMGKMSSLGATSITLYNSSGYVASKHYTSTSGMMGYNRTFYSNTITFSGLSSGQYYAYVTFKASNSSGYDTTSYTTDWSY